ncbi:hypothetical protein [Aquimarina longa]|uniref:hypothetical protein n=1 Tax=Aquimarina longa TaxID=1080221 RepID=UPI000782F720|nr:hypothetical protein [Aquimarina longa]
MSKLSHKIYKSPSPVRLEDIEKRKHPVLYADANFSAIDYTFKKKVYAGIGLFTFICLAGGYLFLPIEEKLSVGGFALIILGGGGGLFLMIFNIVRKTEIRHFTMDRQNGLVGLPKWNKTPAQTFPFNQLIGEYVFTTNVDAVAYENLHIYRNNAYEPHNLSDGAAYEIWSLIVWYMDKNRPLPLGDAFDAYRQQDYERRKAEGFPKPLYPSTIDTPEATLAQQRERKKIGGW